MRKLVSSQLLSGGDRRAAGQRPAQHVQFLEHATACLASGDRASAGTIVSSRTASSTVPFDPITGLVKQVPGYWVFNAMAKHPLTEHIDLQVNVNNIANRYYYDQLHPGAHRARAGRSALVGLEVQVLRTQCYLPIPDVLTAEQVLRARQILDQAEWVDGRVTAGHQSARAKDNMQLPEGSPAARELGAMILAALEQNALFISAALPARVFPPLFNRYQGGQAFGTHVDNAIRQVTGTPHRIRTDLSATLFFAGPGRIRRRRTGGRRHLRHAQRQAAGGPHDSVSRDQPASCAAGDARRAPRVVLLDSEHGARRRRAHAAVRSGCRDSAAEWRRRRSPGGGAVDRRLSQSAAALGGDLSEPRPGCEINEISHGIASRRTHGPGLLACPCQALSAAC